MKTRLPLVTWLALPRCVCVFNRHRWQLAPLDGAEISFAWSILLAGRSSAPHRPSLN